MSTMDNAYIDLQVSNIILWIRRLELCLVERNYLLHVPTDHKSLSGCMSRVQEVNEVTTLAQRRALWSAENKALPQRKALWSAESKDKNHGKISNFHTFLLYLDYELLLRSLCSNKHN